MAGFAAPSWGPSTETYHHCSMNCPTGCRLVNVGFTAPVLYIIVPPTSCDTTELPGRLIPQRPGKFPPQRVTTHTPRTKFVRAPVRAAPWTAALRAFGGR